MENIDLSMRLTMSIGQDESEFSSIFRKRKMSTLFPIIELKKKN